MRYAQCNFKKGDAQYVAWIPEKFAKIGTYLKLDGDNGWLVTAVYSFLDERYVLAHENDYRKAFASLE